MAKTHHLKEPGPIDDAGGNVIGSAHRFRSSSMLGLTQIPTLDVSGFSDSEKQQPAGMMEEVRNSEAATYVVRTISRSSDKGQDDLVVIRQYEMSLSEFVQWFDDDRSSAQLEEIIRIIPLVEQQHYL